MRRPISLLVFSALLLLLVAPGWAEDDARVAAERADLIEQGRRLIEQGSVDYERLQQAIAQAGEEKARVAASGGSLGQMDRLAKRSEALRAQVTELQKARSRLEDAKGRLASGRLDAARQAFNEAAARWSEVHQRIVTHLGEAPAGVTQIPSRTGGGEVAQLRQEVHALRAEVQALRAQVEDLKALVARLTR